MSSMQTRRRFLCSATLAGGAGMLPALGAAAAEPSLETTIIKLPRAPAICTMPQMIPQQLLQTEGFTDIQFLDEPPGNPAEQLARGEVDLMVGYASNFIVGLDKGAATTLLAGVHVGCFVLFGHEDVHGIAGLKGKTVGVPGFGTGPELLLSLMAAEVGLDPKKDLRWIADPAQKPKDLFIEGKSTRSSASRQSRRNCARSRSAGSSSIRRWTGHGRNISAACSRAIASSSGGIRSPPSARCERS